MPASVRTALTDLKASRSSKAQPLPEAASTMSSTYFRTETFRLLALSWCCRKACSKSTARPQPAGMPEVATTASERAPLTRIRRRPRYMSNAKRRASKGKRAASAARSNFSKKEGNIVPYLKAVRVPRGQPGRANQRRGRLRPSRQW
eukprot:4573087-Amphidinium_carterae.1